MGILMGLSFMLFVALITLDVRQSLYIPFKYLYLSD